MPVEAILFSFAIVGVGVAMFCDALKE